MDEYDRYLADTWANEVSKYDRTILALATGALVLSMALVRDAALEPAYPVLVILGWVFLLLSMSSVIWSFTISKSAVEARWRHQPEADELGQKAWKRSIVGGWLLAAGVLLLVVFAWLNLVE